MSTSAFGPCWRLPNHVPAESPVNNRASTNPLEPVALADRSPPGSSEPRTVGGAVLAALTRGWRRRAPSASPAARHRRCCLPQCRPVPSASTSATSDAVFIDPGMSCRLADAQDDQAALGQRAALRRRAVPRRRRCRPRPGAPHARAARPSRQRNTSPAPRYSPRGNATTSRSQAEPKEDAVAPLPPTAITASPTPGRRTWLNSSPARADSNSPGDAAGVLVRKALAWHSGDPAVPYCRPQPVCATI